MKYKSSLICISLIVAAVIVLVSCNSAHDTNQTADPATVVPLDTIDVKQLDSNNLPHLDTAMTDRPDVETTGHENTGSDNVVLVKKTARLGYSYYPKMKRGDTKIIRAYVSINNPESKIRDTIRQIEKAQTVAPANADTSTINIINSIPFYKKINIQIDTTNDFTVKAFRPAMQEIDTLQGNLWLWQITANTDKREADITILVNAENPQGVLENIDIREIKIKIEIDKINMIRGAINYLGDNPKVSVPLLVGLISFIGWLIKYYLEKKKAGDSKKA